MRSDRQLRDSDFLRRVIYELNRLDSVLFVLLRLDLPAPRDSNISEESADEGFDDTDYLDENGKPREVRQSVGPFPNDRKFSTATQEAVYIYQASARAAGKIHDDHIKQHQQEGKFQN